MTGRARSRSIEEQIALLSRGLVDFQSGDELRTKLGRSVASGEPLVVKVGFDPTAPDIHLGHTVVMQKMREFQELGHRIVYVIGDFTAAIGDPSGRSKTRPPLSREQIEANAETYTRQAFKILDPDRTETRFNSEWLGDLGAKGVVELSARYTLARMLERRDFRERLENGVPISVHELLYPLMQAYDSVALRADVELGGTDQLFNLNVGRDIMPGYGLEAQVIMTVPLLEGTDGVQKMSKSLDNCVAVTDQPEDMFGKIMSISDELMYRWYVLLTDLGEAEVEKMRRSASAGESHPKELKATLAGELVTRFHSGAESQRAREQFEQVFAQKGLPDEIPVHEVRGDDEEVWLPKLLVETGLTKSASEARRLIRQGGLRLDGDRITDESVAIRREGEHLFQLGKRRFARIRFIG